MTADMVSSAVQCGVGSVCAAAANKTMCPFLPASRAHPCSAASYRPLLVPPTAQVALREYVLADTGAQNQADSTVRLLVSHSNLQAKFMDIRLDLHVRGGCPRVQREAA